MYETPFYAVTAKVGTRYHDFESKVTITNKPTKIDMLTMGIRERLQNGGMKQVSPDGKVLSYKPATQVSQVFGKRTPITRDSVKAALIIPPAAPATPDTKKPADPIVIDPALVPDGTEPTDGDDGGLEELGEGAAATDEGTDTGGEGPGLDELLGTEDTIPDPVAAGRAAQAKAKAAKKGK